MRNSHWFRRLEIALEFDSGFEIFLLLGRGELARPALGHIAEELRRFGAPQWHRLHLDGLDGLLAEQQPEGVLHLVHGFERMREPTATDVAARLNVNRDRLEVLRGPVIFWIPEDFYEELLRQAPDFVAWRSQATVVPDADLEIPPEVFAEEFLLCRTHEATEQATREVPPLDVLESGVRRPILDWLTEGDVRSLCHDVRDAPMRVVSWCAGELARRREVGDYDKVPVVLPSLLLTLAERDGADDGLAVEIARLWGTDALHVFVAAVVTAAERDAIVARAGGNRVLLAVLDAQQECVPVAQLSEQQTGSIIDRQLSDLGPHDRESWRELLVETVRLLGDRISHFGVFVAVARHWRYLGSPAITSGLATRLWREHSFRNAMSSYVDRPPKAPSTPLQASLDILARLDTLDLARALYEFGVRRTGRAGESLLLASASLFRARTGLTSSVELIEVLMMLARSAEFLDEEKEVRVWAEAVFLARKLDPADPALLVEALDGLGFAQYLAGHHEEAEQTVREAFLLASHARQSSSLLATLGNTLLEQGRLEEALAAAEQGLRQLEDLRDNDDALRLLEICDEACSRMSLHDRALEFATQWFALRRTRSRQLWLELTMFAERLLESGKLERALETVSEAVDLLAAEDETLPYGGQAHPLTLLADIHRALGDTAKAATAMREAVRAYRGLIADGGPWWSTGELAETLLSLAGDLEELGNPEALDHILEAIDIFEQVDASPGKYPANLTNALNRLGDYAATRSMYELATTAYARVLILAEPFPARTSEPVLEIERRLDATCRESGTGLDDALARGRQPITART